MKTTMMILVVYFLTTPTSWSQQASDTLEELIHISRGGQLYDNWWRTTIDTLKPKSDHPLWGEQSTNKRTGYDTFRCKECHGWDYKGKDGAYGAGSHATGFLGIEDAAANMSIMELEASLRGETNKLHDFNSYIDDNDIADLALFMKMGLIDTTKFTDSEGNAQGGDPRTGGRIFRRTCARACHG